MHEPRPPQTVPAFFLTGIWAWSLYNEPWSWACTTELLLPVPDNRATVYVVEVPEWRQLVASQSWDLFDAGYRGLTSLFLN